MGKYFLAVILFSKFLCWGWCFPNLALEHSIYFWRFFAIKVIFGLISSRGKAQMSMPTLCLFRGVFLFWMLNSLLSHSHVCDRVPPNASWKQLVGKVGEHPKLFTALWHQQILTKAHPWDADPQSTLAQSSHTGGLGFPAHGSSR